MENANKTTKEIVEFATLSDIKLFVKKGQLGYKSKSKKPNSEVMELVAKNKHSIIDFLLLEQKREQDPFSEKHTSLSQQRIWLIEKINSNSGEFNIPINIDLKGNWSAKEIKKSLEEIIDQHDILKSIYHEEDNTLWQRVKSDAQLPFQIKDLSEIDSKQLNKTVESNLKNCANYVFDLTKELPIKASFFILSNGRKILNLTIHHIALDDFSCQLLLQQLLNNKLINSSYEKTPQYSEYAQWQKQTFLTAKFQEKAKQYVDSLRGAPALHALPTLNSHSDKTSNNAGTIKSFIAEPLNQKIKALTLKNGLTTFAFYQTCLAKFLSVWTNSDDIVMGTPAIHRPTENTSSMLGCFLNLLVIRNQFNKTENLLDLLRDASSKHTEILSRQDVPFEHLLSELNPHRTPNFTPIFQLLVSMHQQDSMQDNKMEDATSRSWQHINSKSETTKYDLTVRIFSDGNDTHLAWQYKKDLFSEKMIEQLATKFNQFLSQAIEQPEKPLAQLSLACERKSAQLVSNIAKPSSENQETILERIKQHSLETPNAIAIEYSLTKLTYQELYSKVNTLASQLNKRNVCQGDRVAVMMQRSPQMLLSMLAIMKVGAAYVPLDPDYPEERLNYIFDAAQCKYLMQDQVSSGVIQTENTLTITAELYLDAEDASVDLHQDFQLSIEDSAYIIFTSGSTGLPKGVEVTHKNLNNFICSMLKKPGITREDKLLAVTPISFDISILELFAPLSAGACIVIAEQDKRDGLSLKARLEQYDISIMQATPATWQSILDADWIGSNTLKSLCGGEALSNELAKKLTSKVDSLWNMYGPTEATIWATCLKVDADTEAKIGLGSPIDNTGIYILDEHNNICPFDKQGEIIITGDGVAKGYFNQPELTSQRFFTLETPTGPVSAYRTGDLGFISQDQQLFCNGRNDHQVKLRGFRIELPEIENQIMFISGIEQVCVVVKQLDNDSKKLVAYVVTSEENSAINAQKISKEIQAVLPSYMLPDSIEILTNFPLTPSGKVDRNALASRPLVTQEQSYQPPSNKIETLLVDIWQHCLKKEKVGIKDNFFSSGGDSILAVRAVSAVIAAGYQISNAMIFTHQTIQELATYLSETVNQVQKEITEPKEQQLNGVEVLGDGISEDDLNSLLCEFE